MRAALVALQGDGGRKRQREPVRAENDSVLLALRFMRGAGVVEGRLAVDAELHFAPRHAHPADEATVFVPGGTSQDRHEILNFADAVGREEPRDEPVGIRPIDLLVSRVLVSRAEAEVATLFVVEDAGEDAGRIEVREAEPVDRPLHADQSGGPHVPDDAVVFDRLITHAHSREKAATIRAQIPPQTTAKTAPGAGLLAEDGRQCMALSLTSGCSCIKRTSIGA